MNQAQAKELATAYDDLKCLKELAKSMEESEGEIVIQGGRRLIGGFSIHYEHNIKLKRSTAKPLVHTLIKDLELDIEALGGCID